MDDKRQAMVDFWSERVKRFATDARSNTNDVWLRELEIDCVDKIIKEHNITNVLDFGCANGYSTLRLAGANPGTIFVGVDLNSDMIEAAKRAGDSDSRNTSFRRLDILKEEMGASFQFIYAIRVFQNIESPEMQRAVFDRVYELLEPDGLFYYIESYADGYAQLNIDRKRMGLAPLPIHPHLTLLTDDFDDHVSKRLELLERSSPTSSYYLVTRLLYSYLAKMNDEPIDYDHPLHRAATLLPQIGEYGPQKSALYQKKKLF